MMARIQDEEITIINRYTLNTRVYGYKKQLLPKLRGERDVKTIIVGNLNTSLTSKDRSARQKLSIEATDLTDNRTNGFNRFIQILPSQGY